jgi:hypothetical protein
VSKPFLQKGNGHQIANRRKAMQFAAEHLPGLEIVDDQTVRLPPYGVCRFSAYTNPDGAMISTPERDDNQFGSQPWHLLDRLMLFRDFGDGRVIIYVCPIKPLFEKRTIGHHGVRWEDVLTVAEFKPVFRTV